MGIQEHLGAAPAPGGLNAVQDFLTPVPPTYLTCSPTPRPTQQQFSSILAEHAEADRQPPLVFTERDLQKLVDLRSRLRQALRDRDQGTTDWIVPTGVAVGLRQSADGTVVASPRGAGWRLVASLLLTEPLPAQQQNLWPGLKICRNPVRKTAFHDRSRNNIGVWYDVLVCGKRHRLRTSRARRRAARARPTVADVENPQETAGRNRTPGRKTKPGVPSGRDASHQEGHLRNCRTNG
ncbi:CGNR zinc finger domain-containing protein [Streptomyces sp. NPDC026672]|uniref:CGNR zinc finger domain-containing protein n=1 Tax=unclassified Streptomyces TaxID=2593676 RepID=UPI0033E9B804